MAHVLLIEDDAHLRYGVQWNLEKDSHRVKSCERGEDGLVELEEAERGGARFDLVLLDLMLPGISGFDVLAALRERGSRVPVLVLSARADEADAVTALGLGADDYVRKPFGVSELLARIAAVLRRVASAPAPARSSAIRLGDWELDLENLVAKGPRGSVPLTTIECEILSVLLGKRGEVCRREDLLERVWGVAGRSLTRTLDNHVARIRKKLERDPEHPRCIVTVHGAGYSMPRD